MDQILDRLYIGDIGDALDCELKKRIGITAHLSLCPEFNIEPCGEIKCMVCSIKDGKPLEHVPINLCVDFIKKFIRWGKVLVTCGAGCSRSPSIVLCYLYETGWDFDEALAYIKKKRPMIFPSPVILDSLKDYYNLKEYKLKVLEEVLK